MLQRFAFGFFIYIVLIGLSPIKVLAASKSTKIGISVDIQTKLSCEFIFSTTIQNKRSIIASDCNQPAHSLNELAKTAVISTSNKSFEGKKQNVFHVEKVVE